MVVGVVSLECVKCACVSITYPDLFPSFYLLSGIWALYYSIVVFALIVAKLYGPNGRKC